MDCITTDRLVLGRFNRSDYDDLFEFLSQLKDNEFERYTDITYESCVKYLSDRVGSDEFYAAALKDSGKAAGNMYCAVYYRTNDNEDKWIVSLDETDFSDEEILKAVNFQERYFKGELIR